jgi:hypothetical protein
MPVKATIKRRMKRARRLHLGRIIHRVIQFVRIFLRDTFERETGEVRGLGAR